MKKYPLVVLGIFLVCFLKAQVNIVPNYSFESHNVYYDTIIHHCIPTGGVGFGEVPPWDSPSQGSPDLFDTCGIGSSGLPNSTYGYQESHTGAGMVGEALFISNGYREYLQVQLDSILQSQHKYCVSFYVNLADTCIIACNNIGMYFSNTHINVATNNELNFVPQINFTSIVSDQFNWTEITGTYMAQGGEHYIIIGNFYPNSQTDTLPVGGWNAVNWAYYFIDDVKVWDCTYEGVGEEGSSAGLTLSPNPATVELRIKNYELGIKEVCIYSILGSCVLQSEIRNPKSEIILDVSVLAQGLYFVEVVSDEGVQRKKFVKQ